MERFLDEVIQVRTFNSMTLMNPNTNSFSFFQINSNIFAHLFVKANLAARIGPFGLVGLKYGLWFLGCVERLKQRNNTEKNLGSRNLPKNCFCFYNFLQF